MLPLNLYARVRLLMCVLHTRPRVQRAPGLPCALFFLEGQRSYKTPGVSRRGVAKLYLDLTSLRANGSRERAPDDRLREAIHSFFVLRDGLLRFARNDEFRESNRKMAPAIRSCAAAQDGAPGR
jgi:hypothetical protein